MRLNITLLKRIKFKFRASGLAETVAAIAIISATMVTTIGISVRSLRLVKQTEIEDAATTVQLRALEFAKSPAEFDLPTDFIAGDKKSYSLSTPADSGLTLTQQSGIDEIDSCDANSPYFVNLEDESGNIICNQVLITARRGVSDEIVYEINSVVVYKVFDNFEKESILGYRREKLT